MQINSDHKYDLRHTETKQRTSVPFVQRIEDDATKLFLDTATLLHHQVVQSKTVPKLSGVAAANLKPYFVNSPGWSLTLIKTVILVTQPTAV